MSKQVFIADRWETIHGGHTVFEINMVTGEIEPAAYEKENYVKINTNCLYLPCLNKSSASKKYTKWLAENVGEMFKSNIK